MPFFIQASIVSFRFVSSRFALYRPTTKINAFEDDLEDLRVTSGQNLIIEALGKVGNGSKIRIEDVESTRNGGKYENSTSDASNRHFSGLERRTRLFNAHE